MTPQPALLDADLPEPAAGSPRKILAVDDDRMSLFMIEDRLMELGYQVACASDGSAALKMLTAEPEAYEVAVLDRIMPGMNGLDVVARMKDDPRLRGIPVVMVTGANSPEELREGIDAGVTHYLAKPVNIKLLQSVMSAAKRQASQFRAIGNNTSGTAAFQMMHAAKLKFRTIRQAEELAGFLANCFPDPERALEGVAGLLINAVEHGLCKIGFDRKGVLLKDGKLEHEIASLLETPELDKLFAEAAILRKDDGVYLIVTDPGDGFAWRDYLEIDDSRASTSHGRGIARAKAISFNKLNYNAQGNQAIAFASTAETIKW